MFKNVNTKMLYFLSWIFIIIAIINIFLANILFQNTIIELYDPADDINDAAKTITETLEKQSERRALVWVENNANTKFEAEWLKKENEIFKSKIKKIISNWTVDDCYKEFKRALNIDKCVKQYKAQIFLNLWYYNIPTEDLKQLIKEVCQYWQMSKEWIEKCIKQNSIHVKPINIFKCKELYNSDKDLLKECYRKAIDSEIYKMTSKSFMDWILEYNKKLIKVDKKWRVITRKIDSKLLKEHPEYWTMFMDVKPYFVNLEINNNKLLENYPLLKEVLKEYVYKYNNLKQYDIFKYSKYKDKINDKIEIH